MCATFFFLSNSILEGIFPSHIPPLNVPRAFSLFPIFLPTISGALFWLNPLAGQCGLQQSKIENPQGKLRKKVRNEAKIRGIFHSYWQSFITI
jgi:hypothetical protein